MPQQREGRPAALADAPRPNVAARAGTRIPRTGGSEGCDGGRVEDRRPRTWAPLSRGLDGLRAGASRPPGSEPRLGPPAPSRQPVGAPPPAGRPRSRRPGSEGGRSHHPSRDVACLPPQRRNHGHGLDGFEEGPIELLVPRGIRGHRRGADERLRGVDAEPVRSSGHTTRPCRGRPSSGKQGGTCQLSAP